MQLWLEGSWSRALLGGCGKRHIAPTQLVPSLVDATAVPGVSANATSAGPETSWSADPTGLPENAAVGQGEGSGSSRLYSK